jgi:FAD/FMN-containing dehydrogenase
MEPMDISDASGFPGYADQVFTPRHEEEIAEILTRAGREGIPVTVMGALTGLAGGAVPRGGWAISMSNFNKLEVAEGVARAGTGALLRDVQNAALASGQFYPPDPTENMSSIGGNIGANASGSRSFKFGPTRRYVRSLRVVLMDGRIVDYRRGTPVDFDVPDIPLPNVRKFSCGYQLKPGMDYCDLFIGSEGTLGVVTEAELALQPAPGEITGGIVFFPTEEAALDAVDRWRPVAGLRMLEFLDSRSIKLMELPYGGAVIVEWEGDTELDMTGALEEESWFGSSARDRERFRLFRHRLPEKIHTHMRKLGLVVIATDYAVPVARNRDMLNIYREVLSENFSDRFVMFGHIGDAHVHTELLPKDAEEWEKSPALIKDLAHKVVEMGGTVGAEHGLGKRKANLLEIQYSPEKIAAMGAVKQRFDPGGLLGQGTLFQ